MEELSIKQTKRNDGREEDPSYGDLCWGGPRGGKGFYNHRNRRRGRSRLIFIREEDLRRGERGGKAV